MLVFNYIILFVILISLGILYQKYLEKRSKTTSFDEQPLNKSTPPHPSNETRRNKVKKSRSTIRIPQRNRKRD